MIQSEVMGNNPNTSRCNFRNGLRYIRTLTQAQKNEFDDRINRLGEVSLTAKVMEETKQNPSMDCEFDDWNSKVHFFCKN
jgi:hypothetical protein